MEDTLLESMAQLLIDIAKTNAEVLAEVTKLTGENKVLCARLTVLEAKLCDKV